MGNNLLPAMELSLFEHSSDNTTLPKFSIFFNGIGNVYPNSERDLKTLYEEIRNGTSLRNYTEKLRSIKDKKERAYYKKTFPYVTFSGTFRKRSNEGIIYHSGYICIDLDKIGDTDKLTGIKGQILQFFNPGLMFISPSGDGLKIVFKIDISQGTHAEYFAALSQYFRNEIKIDIDPSGKDVSRACFVCCDPSVYYSDSPHNLDRSFINTFNIEKQPYLGKISKKVTDPGLIYQNCKSWLNKNERFAEGNRNRYITKLAGALNRFGVPEYFVLAELSKFAENGFTQHEIESTIKSIFKTTSFHGISKFDLNIPVRFNEIPPEEIIQQEKIKSISLLPIDGLPEFIQSLIKECTKVYGSHSDYWAGAFLSATALAMGNNFKLQTRFTNSGMLWICLVGCTGNGKSEPIDFALKPFQEIDKNNFRQFKQLLKEFELNKGLAKNEKAKLELPVNIQYLINDFTPEAMASAHENNTHGIMISRDELSGWLNDIGRYVKSGEIQNLLTMWSGKPVCYNRVCKDPIRINEPFVSILGGIPPGLLTELSKDNRDLSGFLPRFCFINPDYAEKPKYRKSTLNAEFFISYAKYIKNILSINTLQEFRLSDEAESLYEKFYNMNCNRYDNEKVEYLKGVYAKLDIILLRLALIIHCSKWFCNGNENRNITIETMQTAINITEYFRSTGQKVSDQLSFKNKPDTKEIIRHLSILGNSQNRIAEVLKVSQPYVNKILKIKKNRC
jgi:hypothetical protein